MSKQERETPRSERLDGLASWLGRDAGLPLPELHGKFCEDLVERGFPLWRSSLGLELLHPEQSGVRLLWAATGETQITQAPQGVATTPDYLNSPVRIVDESLQPFRRRLTRPVPELPLLESLRLQGGADYVIFPLRFLDTTRSAYMSFATKRPDGFTDADLICLEDASRLISPYAERRALRRMAIDLLDTYVGHTAGERIFKGQIRRGAVETIEAAILMCDMRGFTALSNRAERQVVVELLDAWFERIEAAIEAHDGEILKFMGDGLLAIFRADPDKVDACRRGYAAALHAGASLAVGFGSACLARDEAPIGFAMGLHVGEVAYGNVGGRRRLDFTVLGPAVNYASRLEDLAKRLDAPLLISQDFARCVPGGPVELGVYPLRGIGDAERIYAAPESSALNALR